MAKDDGGFCFYAVFQVGVHGTPSAKIFPKEVGLGALLSGAVEHPAAMNDIAPPHLRCFPPCRYPLLMGSGARQMKHGRLSSSCGRSWPQAPVRRQQPPWRWGWGRQVLFPRPEPGSQGWKAGVRKLAKVGQVLLALPNPLFHPQPLETPLISPSAVSRGVALLLQDWIYFARFQTMLLQSLKSALFQLVSSNTQARCGSITLVCFSFPFFFF